jgi:O-Antigen ligase
MEAAGPLAPALAVLTAFKWAGVAGVSIAAGAAIVVDHRRWRAAAMLFALVLTPVLLLGEIWNGTQVRDLRDDPGQAAAIACGAALAALLLAGVFRRWPWAMPLVLVGVLPFRVPIAAGDTTANLLVPLYLAVAGGVLAAALRDLRSGPRREDRWRPPGPVGWLLAAGLVLYAVQSAYTNDFQGALEQVVFFLVPFALMARLLLDADWDSRLVRNLLVLIAVEALAFAAVGFWEYQARELLWNPKVISSNQFESYFRVNSVFWDPNIYGRYLVIVMLGLVGVLLWTRSGLRVLAATAALAVLWAGLVLTFSQSSFAALLAGLAVLAAVRWSLRWTLVACGLAVAGAVAFVLAFGSTVKLNLGSQKSLDRATSGRADLVRGGLDLAVERPILGHGSGSFARTYRREKHAGSREAVSASHTEPVTVLAEQGPAGLLLYLGLLATAAATLGRGLVPAGRRDGTADVTVARAVVAAGFGALAFHSLAYDAFLSDPATWVLLAVGVSLAPPAVRGP